MHSIGLANVDGWQLRGNVGRERVKEGRACMGCYSGDGESRDIREIGEGRGTEDSWIGLIRYVRDRQELVRGAPCYSKVEHDHKQECPGQGRSVPTPVPAFESRVLLHMWLGAVVARS